MADLARVDQVAAARPLTPDEQARAPRLIGKASRMIRSRWPDVDARISSGQLDADTVADVVVDLVLAGLGSVAPAGATRYERSDGPYRMAVSYGAGGAGMVITPDMERVFSPRSRSGWLA